MTDLLSAVKSILVLQVYSWFSQLGTFTDVRCSKNFFLIGLSDNFYGILKPSICKVKSKGYFLVYINTYL